MNGPGWTTLVLDWLKVAGFFGLAASPCVWWVWWWCRSLSPLGRLSVGFASGFAALVAMSWYGGLWSFDLLPVLWSILWLIVLAGSLWNRGAERGVARDQTSGANVPRSGNDARGAFLPWVLIALSLVAGIVLNLYPLSLSELPQGVDSTFHCVVGQRQFDAGRVVTSLWPLEDLTLNYPVGSHLWLAVAARWTGLEVHEVFRHSFVLSYLGVGLCVAAWAERLFGSAAHAAAGSFMFLCGSYQVSLFPYSWGGLPSVLALWLYLAGLLCASQFTGAMTLGLGIVLFGATALTHHHAMLALVVGTGVLAMLMGLFGLATRRQCTYLLLSVVGGLVIAGIYTWPLVWRVPDVGSTGTLTYAEGEWAWPWQHIWSWGPALVAAALIGLFVPTSDAVSRRILIGFVILWLTGFVLLDYGGRTLGLWWYGAPVTPFTPSRLVFDAQVLLAILAAGGFVWLFEQVREFALQAVLVGAIAGWAVWSVEPRWTENPADTLMPLGRWIDANLPADALVSGTANPWLTYLCHRESPSLFIPISEPLTARHELKQRLLFDPSSASVEQWRRQLGKPIYLVARAWDRPWGQKPLHTVGSFGVFAAERDRSDEADGER